MPVLTRSESNPRRHMTVLTRKKSNATRQTSSVLRRSKGSPKRHMSVFTRKKSKARHKSVLTRTQRRDLLLFLLVNTRNKKRKGKDESPSPVIELEPPRHPQGGAFRFLHLPGELRNKIYALVLCTPDPIPVEDDDPEEMHLQPQLLATCKKIHDEGMGFLYGDNRFDIALYCDDGGAVDLSKIPAPEIKYAPPVAGLWGDDKYARVVPYMRRFILIVDFAGHLPQARLGVFEVVRRLQAVIPRVASLELDCTDSESFFMHSATKRQLLYNLLGTWLALLSPTETSVGPRYRIMPHQACLDLMQYAGGADYCQNELEEAVQAFEREDYAAFSANANMIISNIQQRCEAERGTTLVSSVASGVAWSFFLTLLLFLVSLFFLSA